MYMYSLVARNSHYPRIVGSSAPIMNQYIHNVHSCVCVLKMSYCAAVYMYTRVMKMAACVCVCVHDIVGVRINVLKRCSFAPKRN